MILSSTHNFLVYADDVNILDGRVHDKKKNAEASVVLSKEIELEVNTDKVHVHVTRSECRTKLQH